jgi:hypothetical protein
MPVAQDRVHLVSRAGLRRGAHPHVACHDVLTGTVVTPKQEKRYTIYHGDKSLRSRRHAQPLRTP